MFDEESKNGLGFEIGPSYDAVPTRSQCLTDRQSSCVQYQKTVRTLAQFSSECSERIWIKKEQMPTASTASPVRKKQVPNRLGILKHWTDNCHLSYRHCVYVGMNG